MWREPDDQSLESAEVDHWAALLAYIRIHVRIRTWIRRVRSGSGRTFLLMVTQYSAWRRSLGLTR
jgi:hypothetical protein